MWPRGAEKFRNSLIIFKMKSQPALLCYTLYFLYFLLFAFMHVCVRENAATFPSLFIIFFTLFSTLCGSCQRFVCVISLFAVRELAKTGEHTTFEHEKQIKRNSEIPKYIRTLESVIFESEF